MSAPLVDDAGVLQSDLICATCEYNLRGLRADGLCPECNHSIRASLAFVAPIDVWDGITYAGPADVPPGHRTWLAGVQRGAQSIAAGYSLATRAIVTLSVAVLLAFIPPLALLVVLAALVLLGLAGIRMIKGALAVTETAPWEPGSAADRRRRRARTALRVLLASPVVAGVLAFAEGAFAALVPGLLFGAFVASSAWYYDCLGDIARHVVTPPLALQSARVSQFSMRFGGVVLLLLVGAGVLSVLSALLPGGADLREFSFAMLALSMMLAGVVLLIHAGLAAHTHAQFRDSLDAGLKRLADESAGAAEPAAAPFIPHEPGA